MYAKLKKRSPQGADGYEISYHSNPRPSHADMGGKQYAIGPTRTVNGVLYPSFEKEAEPFLNDYGCLHFKFSILLGISRPAYSEEQLAQFKAEDNRKIEFEGKEYTRYETSQLQKRIESEVRRQKDRATIAKAAGDDEMRREVQYRINLLTNKYAKLSKESGLPTKMERMQMKGFRKTLTNLELWNKQIVGIVTTEGTKIAEISYHFYSQAKDRKLLYVVNQQSIEEALTKPLKVGKIKVDERGRRSQQYIGKTISVAVNPDTGVIASVWKTSSERVAKLKGDK